jgi:flagellar biosynthesis protein FliQ
VNGDLPTSLLRDGFAVLAAVGGPILGALLAVGLIVGVLQAATQINDPAVGFLPRLVTGLGAAWAIGGWAVEHLARYFATALSHMAERG